MKFDLAPPAISPEDLVALRFKRLSELLGVDLAASDTRVRPDYRECPERPLGVDLDEWDPIHGMVRLTSAPVDESEGGE